MVDYCATAFMQRQKQEIFEDYLTEELRYIAGQLGVKMNKTLHEQRHPVVDEDGDKPVDEIAAERLQKFGITVVRGGDDA